MDTLTAAQLAALKQLDTCTVANAIETFDVRLRNEGFADASIRCMFPKLPPMVGYAATVRIRCSNPPPVGHTYATRTDWWNYVASVPAPRVVVIKDEDDEPGAGAFLGEVHAHILQALDCVGAITTGSVRDVPAIEALGFPLFAGSIAVSRAYVHIVDFGKPVEIGGLTIQPGDLLHADCHGVLSVPKEIAADIPVATARLAEHEKKIIALCKSSEFSLVRLCEAVKDLFD